jgi:urease accessory protein
VTSLEFQRQAWFSPAFPVGGFAYSHGIEAALEEGLVTNGVELAGWIGDILTLGTGRNDAIVLGEACRLATGDDATALAELSDLALALSQAAERRLESAQQGASFLALVKRAWPQERLAILWPEEGREIAFPVAVGLAGGLHGQPVEALARSYVQAFAGNLLAAGIRLAIIGQSEAQLRLAELEPAILEAARASSLPLSALGGSALMADLMALRHETLNGRLFRS